MDHRKGSLSVCLLLAIAMFALPATAWSQATTTISFRDGASPTAAYAGTRETYIDSANPTTNFGATNPLVLDGAPNDRGALIKWDVTAIPIGSIVTGATISVDVRSTTVDTYSVFALLRNWVEGNGTAGSGATWNTFDGVNAWQTPGAQGALDRGTTVLGSFGPTAANGITTYTLNAGGLALVQSWVNLPATNFGVAIQNYVAADNLNFRTREVGNAAQRPQFTITYRPAVTQVSSTTANGTYGLGASINATVNFSEAVTLAGGNLTVTLDTGGTVTLTPFGPAASAIGTYTVGAGQASADLTAVSPLTLGGAATLRSASGADAVLAIPAGQNIADLKAIVIETTPPTVSMSSAAPSPTLTSPIPVTVTFSETVTGFTAGDITATNGVVSNFAGAGASYTFDLTPSGQGTVSADIAPGVAQDPAGNLNTASPTFSRVYDSVAPAVTLTTTSGSPGNVSPIPVTATFSEAVVGFTLADLTVTGGTAGNFVAVSGATYTFDVTPSSAQVTVTAGVAAGMAQDAAGNANAASNVLTVVHDAVAPGILVTTTAASPSNTAPIPMTVTFSEAVGGFVIGDITVGGGTAGNFVAVSGTTYTFDVMPSAAQVSVTVAIAAGIAQDAAANGNTASNVVTIDYDAVAPSVVVASAAASPSNTSPIPIQVTFSEPVSGFNLADVTVTGGTAGNFVVNSTSVYTFDVTPSSAQVTVTVNVAAGGAQDSASNANAASNLLSILHDAVAPMVMLSTSAASPSSATPIPVTATFNEAVAGFTLADLSVTGGSAGNFVAVNGTTFTFDLTPSSSQVTVTAAVAAGGAQDAAGNANAASNVLAVAHDGVAPTVVLTTTSGSPTNASPIPVTATFSEPVSGFAIGDITVTGGSASGFVTVSATVYTFNLTPSSAQVTVAAGIAAAQAQDAAGNGNAASNVLSVDHDAVAPSVVLATSAASPSNTTPIQVQATFSEAVSGFALGDVAVTGGTAGNFVANSASVYTFDVTPSSAQVTVTMSIPAAAAQDAAANGNAASNVLTVVHDASPPSVSLTTTSTSPTNQSPIPVTATFSEAVVGFALADLAVTGGTAGSFVAVSATTYTFSVTPSSPQVTVSVNVPAGGAQDAAGNGNTASNLLAVDYDAVAPTVSMSSGAPDPTNASPIPVTVTFSEPVTGFTLGDITATGAAASGFVTVSATTYAFNLTPSSAQVVVTVTIAAGVAQDSAGNGNAVAPPFSRNFDSVAPTVAMTSGSSNPTNASPIPVTVTFSEPVVGFTVADIATTNATVGNFAGGGASYTFDLTPSGQGAVTADIAPGVAQDGSGNGNAAAPTFSRTFDTLPPTIVISGPSVSATSGGPVSYTITYTGADVVTLADVNVTVTSTGTAAGTVSVTGAGASTRTVTLSGLTGDGTLAISLAAGTASDNAGNLAAAAGPSATATVDNTAPTLTISAPSVPITPGGPVSYTVTYTGADAVTLATSDVTLNATGSASGTIAVSGSGAAARTVTIWSITGDGTLGISIAAATASDLAGNPAPAAGPSATVAVDNTRPTVSLSGPSAALTRSGPVSFTVTYSGADNVTLASGDVALNATATATAAVTVTGSGTASRTVTLSSISGDGTLGISLAAGTASDTSGNLSLAAGPAATFTVDNAPPAAPAITSPADGSSTNNPMVTLSGTAEANSTVTVLDGGSAIGTASANGSGAWTLTTGSLPEGAHPLTATATDGAGNVGAASPTVTVTVDTAAPAAPSISSPTAGSLLNSSTPTLSGSAEPLSTVTVLDGAASLGTAAAGAGGAWSFTSPVLADGSHSFTARATDAAGNLGPPSGAVGVMIDTAVPAITGVSSPTANGAYGIGQVVFVAVSFSEAVTVTGTPRLTLEAGNIDAVVDYTGGSGTSTLTFAYTVASGHQNPDLDYQGAAALALNGGTILDAAGNAAALALAAPGAAGSLGAAKDIVIVNSRPPADPAGIALRMTDGSTFLPLGGTTDESALLVSASVADPDSGQRMRLQVEILPVGVAFTGTPTAESDLSGSGTVARVLVSGLADGSYHVRARIVDDQGVAGNWISFGGNSDPGDADVSVLIPLVNAPPASPLHLSQRRSGGLFPLGVGAGADESSLAVTAVVSDPEGRNVRLQVEARPVGTAFTGAPTAESLFVPSGSSATARLSGLADGPYHWQARTVDASGAASPWVPFGGNLDPGDADFVINAAANAAPPDPTSLSQHDTETSAPNPAGLLDDEGTVVFGATVPETNPLQTVRLQVEVQPIGTAFTGIPTSEGPPVAPGTVASVTVSGLADGDYHWQARSVDSAGATSAWVSFGGNPESAADFSILAAPNGAPGTPGSLAQTMGDGVTAVSTGVSTGETRIVLTGTTTDPDGNSWRLQVEVRPIAEAFTGEPTAESDSAASGASASMTLAGFAPGAFHWRARSIDASGTASSWVSFGGNPDGVSDFTIAPASNLAPSISLPAQFRTDGVTGIPSAGSTNEGTVLFRAVVDSGDAGQQVRLQIEVQPIGVAFTGIPGGTSGWVASGSTAEVRIPGFVSGQSYHWQAWAEDSNGAPSAPVAFATSNPLDADFSRIANAAPASPGTLAQLLLNGLTVVPVGATTNQTGVVFQATVLDPENDGLQLQIEVQPVGAPFADAPSITAPLSPGGTTPQIQLAGFPNLAGFHWQARVIDSSGQASGWVSFGGNPETDADFQVDTASTGVIPGGSGGGGGGGGGGGCGLTGLESLFPLALILLERRARGRRRR